MEASGSESGVATPGLESSASQTTIMTTFIATVQLPVSIPGKHQQVYAIFNVTKILLSVRSTISYCTLVKMIFRGAGSVMPRFPTMGQISSRCEPGKADSSAPSISLHSTYSHSCQQHCCLFIYNAAVPYIHLSVSAFLHYVRCRMPTVVPIHEPDCKPRAVTKIIPTMRLSMYFVTYIGSLPMS